MYRNNISSFQMTMLYTHLTPSRGARHISYQHLHLSPQMQVSCDSTAAVIDRADIFRAYGPAYRKFGQDSTQPLAGHPGNTICAGASGERCRTLALGGHVYTSPGCISSCAGSVLTKV